MLLKVVEILVGNAGGLNQLQSKTLSASVHVRANAMEQNGLSTRLASKVITILKRVPLHICRNHHVGTLAERKPRFDNDLGWLFGEFDRHRGAILNFLAV